MLKSLLCLLMFCILFPKSTIQMGEMHKMFCSWMEYQIDCQENVINKPPTDGNTYCKAEYDGFACWPYGVPGEITEIPCPSYLKYLNESAHTFRHCNSDGTWLMSECKNEPWQNVDACVPMRSYEEIESQYDEQEEKWINLLMVVNQVYPVGCAVSISCLTIALIIFAYFKKLHCTCNYVHMNLMLSFIISYTSIFVKDKVVTDHYDFSEIKKVFHTNYENLLENKEVLRTYCVDGYNTMACRVAMALVQYAVLTNFSWLLAEGVYLQLVISRNFTANKSFPLIMALGWGLPLVPTIIWIILRLKTANEKCWEDSAAIDSAISVSILVTILINFLIFINVIRILMFKLRAHSMTRTDSKYKLARSTLTLILLVGIPCVVFGLIPFLYEQDSEHFKVAYVMSVSCQLTFTSIQGMLVVLLYCFFNSEVQGEIKKFIRAWRKRTLNQELSESNSEQSTSAIPLNTKVEVQNNSMDSNKPLCEMLA